MQASQHLDTNAHRRTRFQRVLMCFVLLLLSIQLLGAAFHKHDFAESESDCATCSFVHHLPTGLPELGVGLAPVMLLLVYELPGIGFYRFVPQTSYLIPRSQPPPRA